MLIEPVLHPRYRARRQDVLRLPRLRAVTPRTRVLLCWSWAGRKALVHPLGGDIPRLIAFLGA